jgi:hypothetical protein
MFFRRLLSLLHLFLFSNVFIALVATSMTAEYFFVSSQTPKTEFLVFVFVSTLFTYCLYWLFPGDSKKTSTRISWTNNNKKVLSTVGASACTLASFILLTHLRWTPALLPSLFFSVFYFLPKVNASTHIKRYAKSFWLALAWLYNTSILPYILFQTDNNNLDGLIIYWVAQFCIIYIICLFFDWRDADTETQHHFFVNTTENLIPIVLSLGVLFVGALWFSHGEIRHLLERKLIVLVTLIIISFRIKKIRGDYWYYLVLDGLMGLPIYLLYL